MITEIRIPQLSVNDPKALIVDWTVKEGDFVQAGAEICVIETSKVTQSIVADRPGYLSLCARVGDEMDVQSVIGWIADSLDERPSRPSAAPLPGEAIEITRKARELASALGVRIEEIPNKGRIIREKDILEYAGLGSVTAGAAGGHGKEERFPPGISADLVKEVKPLSRAQRTIKDTTVKSLAQNAHSYLAIDLDLDGVTAVISQLTARLEHAVRLNDALIFATARALEHCPAFNGFYWNDGLVVYASVNIGLAVDLDGVVVVPVIRDAHKKSLAEIAWESALFQMKVLRRSLSATECEGGTFTITNLSGMGVHIVVPIINGYQAGVLGVGGVMCRPVLREGSWTESPQMTLGLSYDHRIHNGMSAARFLNTIRAEMDKLVAGHVRLHG